MNLATFRAMHIVAPPRRARLRGDDEDYFGGGGDDDGGGGDDGGDDDDGSNQIKANITVARYICEGMGRVYNEDTDACDEVGSSSSSSGGDYGPAPGSCEAEGFVTLPNGQCGPKPGTGTTGSQFKEYTGTPEGEGPPEPEYPPYIIAGIERCAQEDKVYDAASDSCVECGDGQESDGQGNCVDKTEPGKRGTGGGGGGGGGGGKLEKGSLSISLGARLFFGAIGGLLVGGVAYGGARVAGSKSAGMVGGAGALAGAIAGAFVPGLLESSYEAVKV